MKIGDFSKLTGLSVRTLRHWSTLGLLTPSRRSDADAFASDYREFTAAQLSEVNRVLALRDAGFTLAEIGRMNAQVPTREELRTLLLEKLSEASMERLSINHRLDAINARLKHLDFEEDYNMADVTVRTLPPITVASIRAKGLGDDEFSAFFGRCSDDAKRTASGKPVRGSVFATAMTIGKPAHRSNGSTHRPIRW